MLAPPLARFSDSPRRQKPVPIPPHSIRICKREHGWVAPCRRGSRYPQSSARTRRSRRVDRPRKPLASSHGPFGLGVKGIEHISLLDAQFTKTEDVGQRILQLPFRLSVEPFPIYEIFEPRDKLP